MDDALKLPFDERALWLAFSLHAHRSGRCKKVVAKSLTGEVGLCRAYCLGESFPVEVVAGDDPRVAADDIVIYD